MANKIKFTVVDNTTIELLEDAKKGDRIDLSELNEIDTTILSTSIQKEIDRIKTQAREEVKEELSKQIKSNFQKEFEIKELKIQNDLQNKYKENEIKLNKEISEKDAQISKNENSYNTKLNNQKVEYEKKISDLDRQISDLKRETKKTTKVIGENLEKWCDNEFKNAQIYGAFENCTWTKDNTLVKDDNDINKKGTKADYIFKSYATLAKNENEILTSVCCEMKTEDHNSSNKQTNKFHWPKLESNRKKKNCEYSLLITELEMENDFVVQKVNEYPNMYMVRPPYFVMFLGLLNTTAAKFKSKELELIANENKLNEEYATKKEIDARLSELKNEILTKSVKYIEEHATKIIGNCAKIIKLADDSRNEANTIINSNISSISNKIDGFNLRKMLKTSDGKIHYEILKDFDTTQDVILADKNKNK